MATTAASAVTRAQNRAIAKGSDPKAATCRAKLQRARSALNRQMDRELRLREGAENLLRATTKDGGGSENGSIGGSRHKSKNRKLIRQTVALELSFLESNVRLLADELAELNGSVDVYQHRDDVEEDEEHSYDEFDGYRSRGSSAPGSAETTNRYRRRRRQMPMIAVPLKDTRPIDFGQPLERFIGHHYGVDVSATPDQTDETEAGADVGDSGDRVQRHQLSLREAIDELTQLRLDTQTPSRDADGVRLLLRYYRQLYYVDRRFFPPSSAVPQITTTPRHYNHHHYPPHHHQQQDHHHRHSNKHHHAAVADPSLSSPPPAIFFEWYDSFGGPVPSCGQRTVRFEQACVLFNVAAVHTQIGAKYDRRCSSVDEDDVSGGAMAAAQCFLRAAGAYRHIGDTFANAPARATDLRATGLLFAVMMAQAHECVFENFQGRLLASIWHRCRNRRVRGEGRGHRRQLSPEGLNGDRQGRRDPHDAKTKHTSAPITVGEGGGGMNEVNSPSWTELAREAAHVSRMYAEVVYNSCRLDDGAVKGGKENGGEHSNGTATAVLPEAWVSVCRIKDRHYAALAYRYAACALLPYFRCSDGSSTGDRHHRGRRRDRRSDDPGADDLLVELTAVAAAAGLDVAGDDDDNDETTPVAVRQRCRRKMIGKLLLEAAAAAHDRATRVQRLCRQLRPKADGSGCSSGGGLLAGVLDRERQRTVRLLMLHRRDDDDDNEYTVTEGDDDDESCCCGRVRRCDDGDDAANSRVQDSHECCSDDDGVDTTTVTDHCSGGGDQEEFTAGIPGLDVDRGVLIRPRTRFRLMAIAPDFTDTGDSDNSDDDVDGTIVGRQTREQQLETAADREERRADLFAGLGPVAVFSARNRCTRPRWVKVARGGRYRSAGDNVNDDDDDDESTIATADPIQIVDRWFGFELRSHGGGAAGAVPPATVGHVRSNSQAQQAGLRRGDIVVALKCSGDSGSRVLDVRWETCRRVAELVVRQHQRRRQRSSGEVPIVQLKIVTPITAVTASDGHTVMAMDPNKIMYPQRRKTTSMAPLHAVPLAPSQQSSTKQHRRQRLQNTNGNGEANTDGSNKINTWLWNPFRLRRRSVAGNKC